MVAHLGPDFQYVCVLRGCSLCSGCRMLPDQKAAFSAGDVDGVFGQIVAHGDQEFDQAVEVRFAAEGHFKTFHDVVHQFSAGIAPVAFDRRGRMRVGLVTLHQEGVSHHARGFLCLEVTWIVQLVRWQIKDRDFAQLVNVRGVRIDGCHGNVWTER